MLPMALVTHWSHRTSPQQVTNLVGCSGDDKNCQQQAGTSDTKRHTLTAKREKARKKPSNSGWHAPCKREPVPNPNLFFPQGDFK
jgi:hypothetical protein